MKEDKNKMEYERVGNELRNLYSGFSEEKIKIYSSLNNKHIRNFNFDEWNEEDYNQAVKDIKFFKTLRSVLGW